MHGKSCVIEQLPQSDQNKTPAEAGVFLDPLMTAATFERVIFFTCNQNFYNFLSPNRNHRGSKDCSMGANGAKGIVYIYNGDELDVELEYDMKGIVPTPMGGTVVLRRGKTWEVERATVEWVGGKLSVMPALKIYLTDRFCTERVGP